MFIELIDILRCTADHPQINLVAAITRREDRHVIEGVLGCPTCHREYPIREGVAWFGGVPESSRGTERAGDDEDGVVRLGAFLSATEGITVALVGDWSRYAAELAEMVNLRAYAVSPRGSIVQSERVGVLYSNNRLPFRDGSLNAIALGDSGWSDANVELAIRTLGRGGRVAGPISMPVPRDIDEIARDDRAWVGEKRSPLVGLRRR